MAHSWDDLQDRPWLWRDQPHPWWCSLPGSGDLEGLASTGHRGLSLHLDFRGLWGHPISRAPQLHWGLSCNFSPAQHLPTPRPSPFSPTGTVPQNCSPVSLLPCISPPDLLLGDSSRLKCNILNGRTASWWSGIEWDYDIHFRALF